MTELPILAEDIVNYDFLWNGLSAMSTMPGLEDDYIEEQHIPNYNLLIFDQKLENKATEYIFMMAKDLGHNFPNEINNQNEIVAVDILWSWFMMHKL